MTAATDGIQTQGRGAAIVSYHFWDEILKFVEALTKWPPVVLAIAFLFRNRLSSLKFKGKDLELEVELREAIVNFRKFLSEADPEMVKQAGPKLLDKILAEITAEQGEKNRGLGNQKEDTEEQTENDSG